MSASRGFRGYMRQAPLWVVFTFVAVVYGVTVGAAVLAATGWYGLAATVPSALAFAGLVTWAVARGR